MKKSTALLGLALSLFAATASASPPPSYSGYVKLCNLRFHAKVDIVFGQTGTTASVRAQSEPVTFNPAVPTAGNYAYSILVESAVKPNANQPWSATSAQQIGVIGNTQPPVSTGNVVFKDGNCEMRGAVTLYAQCPAISGMTSDSKRIERTWVGCGV